MKQHERVNRIEISSFEVITREDNVEVWFAGKVVGVVRKCGDGFEILQGGRWVYRAISLKRIAEWLENEIIQSITGKKNG